MMINLIFWICFILFTLGLIKVLQWVDSYLDKKLLQNELKQKTLSESNWLLKYEIYRRGL